MTATISPLIPEFPGYIITAITAITTTADLIGIALRATTHTANCPVCNRPATQVHSRYSRTLADCPVRQHPLILRVTARKFICDNSLCGRRIFCKRLALAKSHARTTSDLAELHRTLGLALGGQAGSRLARTLAMSTSGDTLIRRVLAAANEPEPNYRFVGVDDFAIRKGQVYGTILIDLERNRVIELLDGRAVPIGDPPCHDRPDWIATRIWSTNSSTTADVE